MNTCPKCAGFMVSEGGWDAAEMAFVSYHRCLNCGAYVDLEILQPKPILVEKGRYYKEAGA